MLDWYFTSNSLNEREDIKLLSVDCIEKYETAENLKFSSVTNIQHSSNEFKLTLNPLIIGSFYLNP